MSLLFFRASILLTLFLAAGIMVVLDLPFDDSAVQAFITAPENCGGICLLGIQPGVSKVGETMIHLRSHAWVSEVTQNATGNGYAQITWQWSGQQLDVVDSSREGQITFYWDDDFAQPELNDAVIETITIYTHIRIYDLQTWLGESNTSTASTRSDGALGYSTIYDIPGGMMNLSVEMPCPVDLLDYWNARARLTMSIGRVRHQFITPLEMVNFC